MSFKDFIEEYKWLLGGVGLSITTLWAWLIGKKGKQADTGKTEAEREDILFDTSVKRDKYNQEQREAAEKRTEIALRKLDEVSDLLEVCSTKAKKAALLLQQANAELTIYKTITPEKNPK